MKKSTIWRIAVFSAAAFLCAAAFAVINRQKLKKYELLSVQADRRAFSQLCESVACIDSELNRSEYANTPAMLFRISTEINRHSEAAKAALAELPSSELGLDRTSSFLSVAADYCTALALKSASGAQLSEDDLQGLVLLRESSSALANELNSLYLLSDSEDFFTAAAAKEAEEAGEAAVCFSSGMTYAEENMPESPVLIYDGPYSSHITGLTAAFLDKNPEEITVVEGLRIAAEFLGLDGTGVRYVCRSGGDTETYTYSDSEGNRFVSVTRYGGFVITFSENAQVADASISGSEAADIGAEFLASKGYAGMTCSYWYCTDGICYINYEYTSDGVVIYPDLIQVGVRLDNGKVTYMNAYGYLWNNRSDRDLTPGISAEDAAKNVSGANPSDAKLCVIPSDGKKELLCYEFKCTSESGRSFLIYINASSGSTERIFVLVENSNGTLTV